MGDVGDVGYGDTNSFAAVQKALVDKFGLEYKCDKEDCVGHVQKRMGAALRNSKVVVGVQSYLMVELLGGMGRLTDKRIDQLQTYYG